MIVLGQRGYKKAERVKPKAGYLKAVGSSTMLAITILGLWQYGTV
jgi:hypothetical protein